MKTTLAPFHRVFKDKTSGNKKFLSSEYLTHGKLAIVDQGQSTVAGFTDEIDASCKIMLPCVIFGDHTKKFQFQEKPFALGADGVKALEIARDVDPKYAYYAISLFRFPDGTGYSRHFKFLKEAKISLPDDIAEQRRIAAILDKVDAIRRKRQQSLKLADDLVKSQFIEMFGDPVTNPMGWESETIRGVARRISDGPFGSNLKSEHYASDGVRVIRLQNIGVSQFFNTDKVFISLEHYEKLKKYTCRAGDLVIGTLGEPNLRACVVPEHIERAINKADCVHFIPNTNKVNGLFVCHYLNQPATLVLAGGSIHGQTRTRISMSQVAALPIFLPPLALQNEFARFVELADKSKFTMQRQLSEIEILSSALKQKFFA